MGFSIRPAGIKAIKDQKQAQMMFRGDSVKLLYCCLKKDFQAVQLKLLPNWATVDFVVFDPMSHDLYEGGNKMSKEVLINAESIWKGDRNVIRNTAVRLVPAGAPSPSRKQRSTSLLNPHEGQCASAPHVKS